MEGSDRLSCADSSPWVFTASVSTHAERCLAALGIADVPTLNRPIIATTQAVLQLLLAIRVSSLTDCFSGRAGGWLHDKV